MGPQRPPDAADRARPLLFAIGLATAAALTAAFSGSATRTRADALARAVLHVPRATSAITVDGEVDDPAWRGPMASTGMLASVDGRPMTDSSVRMAWGDGELYLLLYAADADIRASVTTSDAPLWQEDSFRLSFTPPGEARARVLYVAPNGTVTDVFVRGDEIDPSWSSRVRLAADVDGTPNDPRDDDEEWALEMAIPFSSLGLRGERGEHIAFSARRCDVPKGATRRCGAWGEPSGEIVLE